MQIIRNRTQYDVCVIGSGAGGGMAAKELTQAGARRGDARGGLDLGRRSQTDMFAWSYESPRRGAGRPSGPSASSTPPTAAGRSTASRIRRAGQPLRLVPLAHARRPDQSLGPDLAALRAGRLPAQELDGLGDDWPITYDDIKPYYDKIDKFIGIFGAK